MDIYIYICIYIVIYIDIPEDPTSPTQVKIVDFRAQCRPSFFIYVLRGYMCSAFLFE